MLSREQALQWCAKHLVEWPEVKPSIAPDGWYWRNSILEPSELILVTDHGKDDQSLVSRITFGVHRGMYDTDDHFTVKLRKERVEEFKTFISHIHSTDIKPYRNQFTASSFSFKYLMKNVHKMARP
jgi:hypothetical protein